MKDENELLPCTEPSDFVEDSGICEDIVLDNEPVSDADPVEVESIPIPDDLELICARERAEREYDEFKSLFPELSLTALPDQVVSDVRSGLPLCAACALYERRRAALLADAGRVNTENRERSFPLQSGVESCHFTRDEVKSMTPADVRTNYKKIIESMYHWN